MNVNELNIRTNRCTVFELVRKANTHYHLWEFSVFNNKVVECVLLRVPLNAICTIELIQDGSNKVVYGHNIIYSLYNFMHNKIALESNFEELDGKYFDDLSNLLKNRFEDTQITIHQLDCKSDAATKEYFINQVNK